MSLLDPLRLQPRKGGYDFVLHDEVLGGCEIEPDGRITAFEVSPDQRRRGIGRRAMELLFAELPAESRVEIEIPSTDFVGRAFAEALGFGVRALILDRRVVTSEETVELFRPVGQAEMDLISGSKMRAFPPRLPEQPIFYPVATLDYARLIASDWNVKDPASGHVGYVLRFRVRKDFLDRHPPREAGGRDLVEYWIPAEELTAFNENLVGEIELIERFS